MKYKFILIMCLYFLFVSCGNDGRGYEYMPNMYRSPSLETYGKNKVFKGIKGKRAAIRKAMVTLAEGQTIDLSSGV